MSVLKAIRDLGKSVIENPRKTPHALRYIGKRLNYRHFKYLTTHNGNDLMARDWDTAIILDACRYDFFAEECTLEGELTKAISPASSSYGFISETFKGRTFHDTVYVTGNPFTTVLNDDTFHDVELDEAWDGREQEAPPGRVTSAAIDAHREYPNKRIIVHYMTPHSPYIADGYGHVDDEIGNCLGVSYLKDTTWSEVRAAYRANLRLVLEHVGELLEAIQGKVVVTADHGEMLGERMRPIPVRVYGHPRGCYLPELVEVPWLEIENGPRREVRAESPVGSLDVDEETKEERLRALGYLDGQLRVTPHSRLVFS